jgi:hypothetical protein
MNRRGFLRLSLCATGAAMTGSYAHADSVSVSLALSPGKPGSLIPADFTGLSYETAQLANPQFFSATNTQLAAFIGRLGPGVLRIGGNTSAYSVWTPQATGETPVVDAAGPDTGHAAPPRRPVTPAAIRNLRDFLDDTGWNLIYGLNMGGEGPDVAVAEAAYVMQTIGPRLLAFQLCNEPDLFYANGVRGADYDYRKFAVEWRRYFNAVRGRLPDAPFAGPDTAYNNDWLVPFAREFRKDVRFLSQHYYAEGPPTDPSMTIARLLAPNPRLQQEFDGMQRTHKDTGLPFRLAETNSCYQGGKPGVSDTFASALWGAELMYQLAAAGGTGINFHGGGYGWYTPIAGTLQNGFVARPLYYGMLMFAQAGPGVMIGAKVDGDVPLLTAYGVRNSSGVVKAAVFNKDAERDVLLAVDPGLPATTARVMRLCAPRIDDTTDVTFGGAPIGTGGAWSSLVSEEIPMRDGTAAVPMPRASAALITFRSSI